MGLSFLFWFFSFLAYVKVWLTIHTCVDRVFHTKDKICSIKTDVSL